MKFKKYNVNKLNIVLKHTHIHKVNHLQPSKYCHSTFHITDDCQGPHASLPYQTQPLRGPLCPEAPGPSEVPAAQPS